MGGNFAYSDGRKEGLSSWTERARARGRGGECGDGVGWRGCRHGGGYMKAAGQCSRYVREGG